MRRPHSWRWGSGCGVLQPSLTSFPTAQAMIPSGNPNGILPQSPGLRRPRRYPGYGWEVLPNPEEGCADGSNGCPNRVWSHHDSGQPFWNRHFIPSKEPDPIPPLFLALPAGTKPLKTGNREKSHAKTPRREEETGFGCLASRRLCAMSSVRCIWSFPPRDAFASVGPRNTSRAETLRR